MCNHFYLVVTTKRGGANKGCFVLPHYNLVDINLPHQVCIFSSILLNSIRLLKKVQQFDVCNIFYYRFNNSNDSSQVLDLFIYSASQTM